MSEALKSENLKTNVKIMILWNRTYQHLLIL